MIFYPKRSVTRSGAAKNLDQQTRRATRGSTMPIIGLESFQYLLSTEGYLRRGLSPHQFTPMLGLHEE